MLFTFPELKHHPRCYRVHLYGINPVKSPVGIEKIENKLLSSVHPSIHLTICPNRWLALGAAPTVTG